MALRFAIDLYERYDNCYIIVQARTPMLRLAQDLQADGKSAIRVVSIHDNHEWRADFSCPLLDVPAVLGLMPEHISRAKYLSLYLSLDDPRGEFDHWHERLSALQGLKVGLCWWSGGHMGTSRAAQQAKSIHPALLKGLAIDGVSLISLQKPA